MKSEWCENETHDQMNVDYFPDGACDCGIHKHHYHCGECGGVNQIG